MKPLKVLFLTPPAKMGAALAAQSFVEEEIRALRDMAIEPHVLTDETCGRTTLDGVPLEGLPAASLAGLHPALSLGLHRARLLTALLRTPTRRREIVHTLRIEAAAATLIAREQIDLVHSHFGWPAGLGGSLAAQATGRPLITSLRGTDVLVRQDLGYGLRLDPAYAVGLGHLLRTASRILVATNFMRSAAVDAGAPPEQIEQIEKGVDTTRFRPAAARADIRQRLGFAGPLVLAVGNLQPRKGFDTIIDAIAALIRRDVTLVVCGAGGHQIALEQRAEACGVRSRVRFEGHVSRDRIADYFAAADVFVHAAELEAAGNVVLEALACATPAVVTDSGGPGEYVDDGVNGFVIPIGDARALALRIEAIVSSPSLRIRLAAAARARIEQRHTYSRMLTDLRAVYDAVLSARTPTARWTHANAIAPMRPRLNPQLTPPTLP